MHLRLLGPFEMATDAGPVSLAGRGERVLVAVLALPRAVGHRAALDAQSQPVGDRVHERAGAAAEAIGLYDEALREWRADPFVDFVGDPWAAVEATRLVELRLAAIAERAERMLSLGRFEEVVADLEPVVAGAPTRSGWSGS